MYDRVCGRCMIVPGGGVSVRVIAMIGCVGKMVTHVFKDALRGCGRSVVECGRSMIDCVSEGGVSVSVRVLAMIGCVGKMVTHVFKDALRGCVVGVW